MPRSSSLSSSEDADKPYFPGQPKSLSGIATRAFCLGIGLATGGISTLYILTLTESPLWRVPFLLATLAVFHFLEFWTQARYNTRVTTKTLFLLSSNGAMYAMPHAVAAVECLVSNIVLKGRLSVYTWLPEPWRLFLTLLGLTMVVGAQTLRSVAMAQAGQSFNHVVQEDKKEDHVLVRKGLYGRFRHPSYFGFYWWAVGTQVVMGNIVSLVLYIVMLTRYYEERIPHEESFLIKFFGDEYVNYRRRVGTGIPFVA